MLWLATSLIHPIDFGTDFSMRKSSFSFAHFTRNSVANHSSTTCQFACSLTLSLSLSWQRQILFNWRFHLSRKNVIHQQGIFVHKKFKHLISATMNQQNYFLFYVSHTISYKQNQCSNIYTSKLIDISYSAARNKQTSEWGREGERAREKKGETERI